MTKNTLPHVIVEQRDEKFNFSDQLGTLLTEDVHLKIESYQRKAIIFCTSVTAIIFFYSGLRYIYGLVYYGYAAALAWSRIGLLIGTLAGLFSLYLLIHSKLSRTAAYLHRDGLALYRASGRPAIFTWRQLAGCSYLQEEITIVYINRSRITAYLYPNHGKPISLNIYVRADRLPEIVSIIKSKLYPILEPALIKNFKAGQILYFHRISLSNTGIKIIDQFYLWEVVDRIVIENGFLLIFIRKESAKDRKNLETIRLSLRQIMNPELILLIARLANVPNQQKITPA